MSSAAKTRVVTESGRLSLQRVDSSGAVEAWLDIPTSLKQPLMAMIADVLRGAQEQAFPVPGGDHVVVRRVGPVGPGAGLRLSREPRGFPPEGRDVTVTSDAVALLLSQVRGV